MRHNDNAKSTTMDGLIDLEYDSLNEIPMLSTNQLALFIRVLMAVLHLYVIVFGRLNSSIGILLFSYLVVCIYLLWGFGVLH